MRFRNYAFLILVCLPFVVSADTTNVDLSRINRNISLQLYAGLGLVNGQQNTEQAVSFRGGYKDWFVTGRMFRQGEVIFENSWMAGYRIRPHRNINIIVSVGFSDVAFIKDPWFRPHGDYAPGYYKKYYGMCGEIEAEYQFHVEGKATAWGLASSYYYGINGWRNLGIFSVGLKFHLLPIQEASFAKKVKDDCTKAQKQKLRRKNEDTRVPIVDPQHQLRMKIGLSCIRNTHLEFEWKVRERIGVMLGVGARYSSVALMYMFYETFMGPDFSTKGAEVYGALNYYTPTKSGWYSLGLRTGFGHYNGVSIYAWYHGTVRLLNRMTEEIKVQSRFAYTLGKQNGMTFTMFASTGAKIYYAQTQYMYYVSTPTYQGSELRTDKRWNVFPAVNMGFQLGVGW